MVLPPAVVAKLYERISNHIFSDSPAQQLQLKLFSHARQLICDKNGRVNVPELLLKRVGIDRDVVAVGTMTKFGLWSPERWAPIDPEENGDNLDDLMREVGL
jgi:MraZ protein